MCGVIHNAVGSADAVCSVNVCDKGKRDTLIFSAVLTIRYRVLRSETVEFINQAVMQLFRTLSMVPLENVVMIGLVGFP